jgi:hypothetical protein
MGTNYYLHQKPDCECCGRPYEPLHIGKSSGGWCFSLHVIPEDGINTLDDWRNLWAAPGVYIRDGYGNRVSVADMELTITVRRSKKEWGDVEWHPIFYESEQDFHDKNHSERGPNGLLRHRIGTYCNVHGEGTWDYIEGEFS